MQGFGEQVGAIVMLRDRNEDRHLDFWLLAKNRRRECFTIALSSRRSFGPRIDEMGKGESHTVLGGKLGGVAAGTQYPRLGRLLCDWSSPQHSILAGVSVRRAQECQQILDNACTWELVCFLIMQSDGFVPTRAGRPPHA